MKNKDTMKPFKYQSEFQEYLENMTHIDDCVKLHLSEIRLFFHWLVSTGVKDLVRITTPIINLYIKFNQELENTESTINNKLNSLRKYYDCLIQLGHIQRNPALAIHVGRKLQKVVQNPLTDLQLSELYHSLCDYFDTRPKAYNYKQEVFDFVNDRNKLIVGLLIFQGLDTGELDRLKVEDINPSKGTIYIASKNRRSSRTLKMDSAQTIPFYEYLRNVSVNQEKLFEINVRVCISNLLEVIKSLQPLVKNAEHIRQSRIMVLVETLDIRTAQYNIGHKFVSSTEKYRVQDTSSLVEELNLIHLFKY